MRPVPAAPFQQQRKRTLEEQYTNVPNSTDMRIPRCHDADHELRDAMPKSGVSRGARRNRRFAGWAALPDALEGQIEEICRDMAVQVKRMRQLQEQADELRTTLREWAGGPDRIRT